MMFVLGNNGAFDDKGILMSRMLCTLRMYKKDKPDKYIAKTFILANTKYFFIYHIDMYQGNNSSYIDIHTSLHKLTTKQNLLPMI